MFLIYQWTISRDLLYDGRERAKIVAIVVADSFRQTYFFCITSYLAIHLKKKY